MNRHPWTLAFFLSCCLAGFLTAAEPTESKADVKELLAQLRSKEPAVRVRAAQALGDKGEDAKAAVRELCRTTLDASAKVKQAALEALEKLRPELYKPLVVVLREEQWEKHMVAVKELGLMGAEARDAAPVLVHHLRWAIAVSTTAKPIRPAVRPRTKTGTTEATDDNLEGVHPLVAAYFTTLEQINPDDPEPVKTLAAVAGPGMRDEKIRASALRTLGRIGEAIPEHRALILPTLVEGLKVNVPNCQRAAAEAAGRFGEDAKKAVEPLKKLKLAGDEGVRKAASTALDKIETP